MDFDTALTQIGEFGRFQQKIFFLVNILAFPVSAQMLILVFAALNPQWNCENPGAPKCSEDGTLCPGAQYSSNFTSIASEWNLVCSQSYKNELAQSIFMAGNLIGCPLIGNWADKYGRKRIWIIGYVASVIFTVLSAVATSYNVFVFMRFLVGIFGGGTGLLFFILSTESVGASYRGLVGTVQQAFFAVFLAMVGSIGYAISSWRLLIMVTVIPAAVQVLFFRSVPESPRWLASQGRYTEAEEILHHAAKVNGKILKTRVSLHHAQKSNKKTGSYGIIDIFTHKSTCQITSILALLFFVNSLVYYGLSLNVKNLGGSLYINFVFAGLIELPSYVLTAILISWAGRRKSLFFFMMGAAASCCACMKLQESAAPSAVLLSTTAMSGKFFISASFAVIYVYGAELLPTVVRSAGLGVASIANRTGSIMSPFVVLLAEHNRSLPMLIFAVTTVVVGIIGLKLPETRDRPLPETFEDMDHPTRETVKNGNVQA